MKDILIKSNLPYLPEALNRIFCKSGTESFQTYRFSFFPFSLAKTISITEHEHLHMEGNLALYLTIVAFFIAGKATFFSRSFIYFSVL